MTHKTVKIQEDTYENLSVLKNRLNMSFSDIISKLIELRLTNTPKYGDTAYKNLFIATHNPQDTLSYNEIQDELSNRGITFNKRKIGILLQHDMGVEFKVTTHDHVSCRRFIGVKFNNN